MHPDRRFAWRDEGEMRAFVATASFAQIYAPAAGALASAQAPLAIAADGTVRFHLARANALTPYLDGAAVLASVVGQSFYVSPDWYGSPDQVPTWNYRLVEIRGVARRLDETELRDQLDRLSAAQEGLLAPKPAWTSAKMNPARLAAMLMAIVGFAIEAPSLSGTAKLSQNKSGAEAAGVAAALRAIGRDDHAAAIEAAW